MSPKRGEKIVMEEFDPEETQQGLPQEVEGN